MPDARITLLDLDLGSISSVRRCAEEFLALEDSLDVLLLNAGIAFNDPGMTEDGFELQFGTNHVGHALLTQLLMPALLTAAERPNSDVRIVVVASEAHSFAPIGGLVLDKCRTEMAWYGGWQRYGQSKLANILFAQELARRCPRLTVVSLHPGGVRTPVIRTIKREHPWVWAVFGPLVDMTFVSVEEGAKNQIWACVGEGVVSGQYYNPVGRATRLTRFAGCDKLARQLWLWTEDELRKLL